jgi:N-methylhydantoinase A/oxoprolinase/acetone carboxylase beta subunit
MPDVLLGIDTGGTYTDGVIMDFQSRKILKKTKTLTTKNDLTVCILNAIDALLPENPADIQLVSISTTLATNAVVEGKRKPVALFLLGYDQSLVKNFQFESQFATSHFFFIEGGHDLEGNPQKPLDIERLQESARSVEALIDAAAISGYFSPLNTAHEELAAETLGKILDKPFVLGSQLSSRLNSIKRATTAALNASLLSTLNEFVQSIENALQLRGIHASLMIMHSDGSLMNAEKAKPFPIETVHSGPAASAVGAHFLAGVDKALVVDIGGTTTDIAIIDHGRVNVNEDGTKVGDFNTAVRAADVRSFGLGGDSMIWLDLEDQIQIGPQRCVPLSYLAHEHPKVRDYLESLTRQYKKDRASVGNLEFWFLIQEPKRLLPNDRARQVIDLLREAPLSLPHLLEKVGLFHQMQFDGQSLIREEIVGRAALTPTDLFHLTGEFAPWDATAADLAASLFTRNISIDRNELVDVTKEIIAEKVVEEVVSFITRQSMDRYPSYVPKNSLGAWLFEENIHRDDPYLGSQIRLKMPVIGIGAPARLLLPRVAELLHTDLILPEHHEVANAIGAVVGSMVFTKEAWIYPKLRNMFPVGVYVQTENDRKVFRTMKEAASYAEGLLEVQARKSAREVGAKVVEVDVTTIPEGAESFRIRVTAIGVPEL